MKKFKRLVLVAAAFLLFQTVAYSQPGSLCTNPYVITALPFNQTGMTTAGFPDTFDNTDACTSNYMTGNDFIFTYTPASDQYVNISLTNTGNAVGLFVIDACPDQAGAVCVASNEGMLGNPSVSNVLLNAGTTYYIIVSTMDPIIFVPNPSTAFGIQMVMINPYDLALTSIVSPITGCSLSATEDISIEITNNGIAAVDSFLVEYVINGGTPVTDTVYNLIMPDSTLIFTFTVTSNFSTIGTPYNLVVYSKFIDSDPLNDTLSTTINNLLGISSYPYLQDFETTDGGWVEGGLNSSWEWGSPVKPIINHAASPTKCWVTSLTTNANMLEMSNLTGPCFDFTSLTTPEIEFNIWYSTSSMAPGMDSIILEVSIDSGASWSRVGDMFDASWYNTQYGWSGNLNNWIHVRHTLDSMGGKENVHIRLSYYGPMATICEGVAIDDIYIHEAPINDLGVTEISAPLSGCNLSNQEYVGVFFTNFGQNSQNHFPISYQINGGQWRTDTINSVVYYGETLYHGFTQTANLSAAGNYIIKVTTGLTTDENHSNDTITATISNSPGIDTYPYSEDFETDDGDWYTEGTSSWAWGVPASPIINSAHSPTKAWKTNLSGNTLANEESYLYSPCMDFTGYSSPAIEMYVWHETTMMMGATAVLEASIDGGSSWSVIGPTDTSSWYVTSLTGGYNWTGSSAGWQLKKHALDNCGNQSGVKLRVHYLYGQFSMVPEEGIAIDDIHIFNCVMPVPGFTYAANGGNITFTNSTTGGTTYHWNFGDGNSSTSTNTSHNYTASGTYLVTLTAYNDCGVDSISQTINVTIGGLGDISFEKNIICSPNPSNGNFNLIISDIASGTIGMAIFNLTGSEVYHEIINCTTSDLIKQIDMTSFCKGVYYLQLTGKDINTVRKIVIE